MATIKEVLQLGREQLQDLHESAPLEAELLLAHVLNKPRSHLFTWPEDTVSDQAVQDYAALIHSRREGQPVAYLLGEREFWSMPLKVTPATLIPRPETELLVEQALQLIPEDAEWQLLELGTGCGAIAIALAKERPGCQVTAVDSYPDALAVAEENAHQNGVNVTFIESHWFSALPAQQFHLIVSNPPYVPALDPHLKQGDVRFEPQHALIAGEDGLDAYREILASAGQYLQKSGWILFEHGYDQAAALQKLLQQHDFRDISTYQDSAGQDRVTAAHYISQA